MKIIQVHDMSHEIFNGVEIPKNSLEIYRFEDPQGYLYINKGKEVFSIHIHSTSELMPTDELKKILLPYFYAKSDVTIGVINTAFIEYLKSMEMNDWFGMYYLHLEEELPQMTKGVLQPYQNELDIYVDIFGRCFEPMRRLHDFKPYDWYKSNQDEAKKEFEEVNEKGGFFGYVVDGQIVGGGIAFDNEIDILAIKPELQCNGHGRELLRGIVNELLKKHSTVTIAVVESNQHVLKFYMSEGFILDRHEKRLKNY